jgi:hypothetical protein
MLLSYWLQLRAYDGSNLKTKIHVNLIRFQSNRRSGIDIIVLTCYNNNDGYILAQNL